MKNLKDRWKIFISLLFDPFTIILLISSIILVYFASVQTNNELKAILTILTSISSAILGSRIMTIWSNETEGRVIIARGGTAIRNLSLLLKIVSLLEQRVLKYLANITSSKTIKIYFEEIIEKFHIIEEEIINSIEDWKDIIPEANIKHQIGLFSDLKSEINEKTLQLKKLEEIKNRSESDKKELQEKIDKKQQEIFDLKQRLREKTIIDPTILSTLDNIYLDNDFYNSRFKLETDNIIMDNSHNQSFKLFDNNYKIIPDNSKIINNKKIDIKNDKNEK